MFMRTTEILKFYVTQLTSCCNIEVRRAITQAASHYEVFGSFNRAVRVQVVMSEVTLGQ